KVSQLEFAIADSRHVWKHLEDAAYRSQQNLHRVFEDFLTVTVCALAGGTMENEYLSTIKRYCEGKKAKRAIDSIAAAFAMLIGAMENTGMDILGDMFMGGITRGEAGQYFTPEPICHALACMTITPDSQGKRILDPCCGSG